MYTCYTQNICSHMLDCIYPIAKLHLNIHYSNNKVTNVTVLNFQQKLHAFITT